MVLKVYAVGDGPPSASVRQAVKFLNIPHELISVEFIDGDHLKPEYAKMNPQKEIPVIDDDGFCLGESNAILQYLCDKYSPDSNLYPRDPQVRALVNHRLCFNLSSYYVHILPYSIIPIFFDAERTEDSLKNIQRVLGVFETYLERLGTSYVAADHLTIADFPLVNSTMCLETIYFDFSKYPRIQKWYSNFKQNHPDLWKISEDTMNIIRALVDNPPDLAHLNHPLFKARKINK